MAYLSGYTKRKKITISNTNVISNLTNFPVMVKFTSDSDIGGLARSDGYDIRFTSSDGTTLLDYERELFSISSGNASGIFWVCVPTVTSSTPTDIYIYFGKADASSDTSTRTFWDTDYSNIYHFGEYGSGLNDSSTYSNHLTNSGLSISNGKATLDGSSYAEAEFEGTISKDTTRMLSAVAKTTGGTGRRTIMAFSMHQYDLEAILGHRFGGASNALSYEIGSAGVTAAGEDTDTTITSDDIYHISIVYKDTHELDFYINGIYDSSFAYPSFIVGRNEIQKIEFSTVPTRGQFKLTEGDNNIAYNDVASTIESGLVSTFGVGGTSVSGDYTSGFLVEFTGANANTNIGTLSLDNNTLAIDGTASVVTNTEGSGSDNEVQTITVNTGTGSLTISWAGYGSITIPHNESNSNVQSSLDTLFGSGNTVVSGPGNGPWAITFQGALELTDMPTPTFDYTSLTIPVDITISTTQTSDTTTNGLISPGDLLVIGAEPYEGIPDYFFTGEVYEARLSLIERSPAWIKFEAKNLLNGETSFSSLQTDGIVSVFKPRTMVVC